MAIADLSLVAFAYSAGVFTFFAPCAYPLLPGYISYYLGQTTQSDPSDPGPATDGGATRTTTGPVTAAIAGGFARVVPGEVAVRLARATIVGLVVSTGFFVVYGLLAGVVAALGARILAGISVLELVVGSLLIVIGAVMLAGWKPPTPTVQLPKRQRSLAGYFGFGVIYAAAAAGCTAPIFIGVALKSLTAGTAMSAATFGAYAAGMSTLMIGVTVLSALGRNAVLKRLTRRMDLIHRVAGALLVIAGLVQIYFFLFRFDGLRMLGFG